MSDKLLKNHMDQALMPKERAEALLEKMSLKEKMGQVVCYIPDKLGEYQELKDNYPAGVGQVSCLQMRMLDTLEDSARLQREVQEKVMEMSEHHIPAIFHMEGLCGAFIQGATSFPSGIGRASAWNPELEEEVGKIVGRQERAVGITHTFAPVLDISRDSRMGRQGETYGEDPVLASSLGVAYTRGLQSEKTGSRTTEAVAKHFLGFHDSQGGIHGTDANISGRQLREVYAKPFQASITEAGLKGIMPCYCSLNGEPVSASKEIMNNLLREEMGFEGITVSDYCAIMNIHSVQKVCESFTEAGLRAMEAGMDMELHFKKCYNEELEEWFASGKADINILNKAVLRILETKFRMGLFEHPYALADENLRAEYAHKKDEDVTLQYAKESLILLKNDGVLPISKDIKKIAVIGYHASTARIMYGGYTHFSMAEGALAAVATMAGLATEKDENVREIETIPGTQIQQDKAEFEEVLKKQNPNVKSLLEEIRDKFPDGEVSYSFGYHFAGDDMSYHEEALEAAKNADLVILTLGGKHGTSSIASMGEGIDSADINLPLCQESFIEKVAKLGKPLIGIHFNGRPISSNAADQYLNAIIEAWNPAEKGSEAIVSALLGKYNPSGKLPVSVAYSSGQIQVYYNHPNGSAYHQGESIAFSNYVDMPHTPRYFFGHGLSYTEFTYSNLAVSDREISPRGELTICVDIENTGGMAGEEVVQLYVRDRFASMTRPVMELAGFKKLGVNPGEKKTVSFQLQMSQMAFLDREMKWKVEAGEIDVMVGSASNDIRCRESFRISDDLYVEGKTRAFYARAEVR